MHQSPTERTAGRSRRVVRVGLATACAGCVLILVSLALAWRGVWTDEPHGSAGQVGSRDAGSGEGRVGEVDSGTSADGTAGETSSPRDSSPPGATSGRPARRPTIWADPSDVGRPWGTKVNGLLTFRGNPSRTFYGVGPVPRHPEVLWRFPTSGRMCSVSDDKEWCGTGWTGQPAVWEWEGRTWVAFGAYDSAIHFLDADTGERLLPDFHVGDIVKGSVTVDPDGFPILYSGSRDGNFRAVALDRPEPAELWRLGAHEVSPTMWNDDWDSSALVVGDHLLVGGENSQFHVVRLGRGRDGDGLVELSPRLVFNTPSWDEELLAAAGDREMSVEGSVALHGSVVWFANSAGLVQGWDLAGLDDGERPIRVFRFWTGEDTDASVVVDQDGMLYVASEYEKRRERARRVGQLMKLDPRREDPLVWSVHVRETTPGGLWATPALFEDLVIAATNDGRVLGVERDSGGVRWELRLPGPLWQSPVVVDGVLIQGDCAGVLHAFDVSDTAGEPRELWSVQLGGCIESTPAVWKGRIWVGTRGGAFFGLGDG